MSPDSVNVTEDGMMNPSSTLNKYAYGANNPLTYTDPDGKDITSFYEPGNPISGSPGHTMLLAMTNRPGSLPSEASVLITLSELIRLRLR